MRRRFAEGTGVVKEFRQIVWDERVADDCRQIIRLAVREELDRSHDLTTVALVAAASRGAADIVVRQPGVLAGLPAVPLVISELNLDVSFRPFHEDGDAVAAGTRVVRLDGATRHLLTAERLILNLLGRLSGIATLTRQFVRQVAGTRSRIYDTRKTTPGWRRLEKYAVRCGGGSNHRTGLFDAVLIKDNHLAQAACNASGTGMSPAEAVRRARRYLQDVQPPQADAVVEVEVDTLDQLEDVLGAGPDIILLDNMSPPQLREAVRRRDESGSPAELEASGGITLATVRQVAESGVERISIGALTHSAAALDIGLDWRPPEPLEAAPLTAIP